jgi:hypothetical protein
LYLNTKIESEPIVSCRAARSLISNVRIWRCSPSVSTLNCRLRCLSCLSQLFCTLPMIEP